MTPWLEAVVIRYGWIAIGLTFGLAAKYALLIKRGVKLRPALFLADLLLLPMVALVAYFIASRLGAHEEMRALLTAFCTVGADRIITKLTERFAREVESEIEQVARRVTGEVRNAVQTEQSAAHIIDDTLLGRAPEEYETLKRKGAR